MSIIPGFKKFPFNIRIAAALLLVCLPLPAMFGLALNTSQTIDQHDLLSDPAFGVMMASDLNLLFGLVAGPIAAIAAIAVFRTVVVGNREIALQLEALAIGDEAETAFGPRLNGRVARALEEARQTQQSLRVRLKVCLAEAEREHKALSRELIRLKSEQARIFAELQAARLTQVTPPMTNASLPVFSGTPVGGGLSTPFEDMDPGPDPFSEAAAFGTWIPAPAPANHPFGLRL